jgi:peroxiredoxin
MPATAHPEVGQLAPDFSLKGPGGQIVALSDYRGRQPVVIAFFPLAFSPTCSHQLPTIEKEAARFRDLGAEVLGISVDSHHANQAFARHLNLSFPLLSDWKREASAAYGVLLPDYGYSGRALFVVDRDGRIVHGEVTPTPDQIPSNAAVLRALEALRG